MYSLRSVFKSQTVSVLALLSFAAAPYARAETPAVSGSVPAAAYMPVGGRVSAPTGFLELCVRSPVDCQTTSTEGFDRISGLARTALIEKRQSSILTAKVAGHVPAPMPAQVAPVVAPMADSVHDAAYVRINMDTPTLAMVVALNDKVNHAIKAETDQQIYHVPDYWTAPGIQPGAKGDCEDFALEKRRLLISVGVPAEALSLAIVRTPAGEAHAVLVVSAKQGDYILDNLQHDVKQWQMTDYSWISRQGPGDDLEWVSLAPANARHALPPVTVANR